MRRHVPIAVLALCGIVVSVGIRPLAAQSLADLAKKEEERRKAAATPPTKTYSNKDLVFDPDAITAGALASAPAAERPKMAAGLFLGYYLKHTRGYSDYCRENWGIDLTSFVSAFSSSHQAEYARAEQIVAAQGMTDEMIWGITKLKMQTAVEREMSDIPGNRGSLAGCRALNMAAVALATQFHFSKVLPEAHKALMAGTGAK